MRDLLDRVRAALGIHDVVRALDSLRTDVLTVLRRPEPSPPAPFVCVLIEGLNPMGQRVSIGTASELVGSDLFELTTNVPLTAVRVIVFADFRRVEVTGVFCGVDYMHGAVGEAPIAYVAKWDVGVKLRVQCGVRR